MSSVGSWPIIFAIVRLSAVVERLRRRTAHPETFGPLIARLQHVPSVACLPIALFDNDAIGVVHVVVRDNVLEVLPPARN